MKTLRLGVLTWTAGTLLGAPAADAPPTFESGGDLRLRQEYYDRIPVRLDPPGEARGGLNHYLRVRGRAWGRWRPADDLAFTLRVTEEFRVVRDPKTSRGIRNAWRWPDEAVVDQLYMEARALGGGPFDLKLGRQDLSYGAGRVIREGTPEDGSRTLFMDAVVLTWKATPATSVDAIGLYNRPENELGFNLENRDLTGLTGGYNNMTESGGGLYARSQAIETCGVEAYYLFKHQSSWTQAARVLEDGTLASPTRPGQTLDVPRRKLVNPELDLHTVGFRLLPKFDDTWDGALEIALQTGESGGRDMRGWMLDAAGNRRWAASWKPVVTAGCYLLSGDDPGTAEDESWTPPWARNPQSSELLALGFESDGVNRWTNLSMPHLDVSCAPREWLTITLTAARVGALEADGASGGRDRGLFLAGKAEFRLARNLWRSGDKLSGHLWLEWLEPGDYYRRDESAVFARWELLYAF